MFLVIPVEYKPSLRSPPWMTILLILIHVLIYFGWQVREESAVQRMAQLYAKSTLPALELPQLVEYVGRQAKQNPGERKAETAAHVETAFRNQQYASLYVFMWQERQFRQDLLAERIIRPGDDHYETWRLARRIFNLREPQAFTARWALDYSLQSVAEVLERPLTLLTSGFLHGSFGHLLGNMIFLFIFGFALEKALGAGRYLAFYLLSGVGASAVAAWAYAGSGSYGLGASGAIAGLMGMYAVQYRMRRIQFFYYILFYFNYARLGTKNFLFIFLQFLRNVSLSTNKRLFTNPIGGDFFFVGIAYLYVVAEHVVERNFNFGNSRALLFSVLHFEQIILAIVGYLAQFIKFLIDAR